MEIIFFEDFTLASIAREFNERFIAVLDKPELKKAFKLSDVLIAGWIIPPGNEYYELIVEGDFGTLHIPPNIKRPDVAQKIGAVPLTGQEDFNGFHAKVPFSNEIKIGVRIKNSIFPWKVLRAAESPDFDSVMALRNLLAHGEKAEEFGKKYTSELAMESAARLHRSVTVYRSDSLNTLRLNEVEKSRFAAFKDYLSSSSFLGRMLKEGLAHEVCIPSPFSSSRSILVGSVFKQINFLIFECEGERFYIGQYLHSADFIYVPSRDFLFVLDNAVYNHDHLHSLMLYAAKNAKNLSLSNGRSVNFSAVLINGVSPYHFFYDCLAALYIASQEGGLNTIEDYYVINSRCYFDVRKLRGVSGNVSSVNEGALSLKTWGIGSDALCVAGVSYKSLSIDELAGMDRFLIATAQGEVSFASRYKSLESSDLVIWIGISQQKRAWLNQKEALVETIIRLSNKYKKVSIIFDGMTTDVFGCMDDKSFAEDALVVSEIRDCLPSNVSSYTLVGCGSLEKIFVASKTHFFISNYSTGSMYPARFFGLPGVAHLSNSMLSAVKDMHIHSDTQLVPAEYVIDVPDESCNRVDFVSYRIDKDFFGAFVEDVLASKIKA
ncbi:hypothetical protein [Ectopseudomonas guguanensis]|nr:hypothetical protein [Pseudomonas guguanensis]